MCIRDRVEGELYQPEGQALTDEHLRVTWLRPLDPQAALVHIGPRQTRRGRFVAITGEPGSKLAGETRTVFVDDAGHSHELAHLPAPRARRSPDRPDSAPADPSLPDHEVSIESHPVELSPHSAHVGGSWLWVLRWSRLAP